MIQEKRAGRHLFFDLSDAVPAVLTSFFEQAEKRLTPPLCSGPLHWILTLRQARDFLVEKNQSDAGSRFFAQRQGRGDRFFCSNPGGWDWGVLFPEEARRETESLRELPGIGLWLKNSLGLPAWCKEPAALAPLPNGLHWGSGEKRWELAWSDHQGAVVWKIPGQVLVDEWPVGQFSPLPLTRPTNDWDPSALSPERKVKLLQAGGLRAKPETGRKTPLNENKEFPGLGYRDAVDFEEALGGIRKRSLVASMQGTTDLREGPLRLSFRGGHLKDALHEGIKTPLISGSDSYLVWGRQKRRFETVSAFSFEGDASWGLRESLVLNDPDLREPGRLILDYFFVEDCREFFVAASVRWPRWLRPTSVEARAILELEAFSYSDAQGLTIRSVWPDGSTDDRLETRKPESGTAQGVEFAFSAGQVGLVLGFPQNQIPRPHTLPWKTARGKAGKRLVVNPEGSWTPENSQNLEGWEEHFTFFLTVPGGPSPYAVTRKTAGELIPPYVVLDTPRDPA